MVRSAWATVRTIRLSVPAAEALADLEATGAIGSFSSSTVRRALTERYTLGHVPEAMRLATSRFEQQLKVLNAPPTAGKRATRGARR